MKAQVQVPVQDRIFLFQFYFDCSSLTLVYLLYKLITSYGLEDNLQILIRKLNSAQWFKATCVHAKTNRNPRQHNNKSSKKNILIESINAIFK